MNPGQPRSTPMLQSSEQFLWWKADKGAVWRRSYAHASNIERRQAGIFNRILRCRFLYDPNAVFSLFNRSADTRALLERVTENVVASNIDTVTAVQAAADVRARFMTDDADWSTQRQARQREFYANELCKLLDVDAKVQHTFKEGATVGSGLIAVYADQNRKLKIEEVLLEDVIADEQECRFGPPRTLHRRSNIDRETLKEQFPSLPARTAIDRAGTGQWLSWRAWVAYQKLERNECAVLESWRLPIGVRGMPNYVPGRHVKCVDGFDLLDEEWHKDHFGLAKFDWTRRTAGFYGISLTERIAGHQRALNKRNWQIDRTLDQAASPTVYVRQVDAAVAIKTTNQIGNIVPIKGDIPQAPAFPQVHPEVYKSREDLKAGAFEETGLSRMAAASVKPAGIDSAVGMREYRDQGSQRFAIQEKDLEKLKLDGEAPFYGVVYLVMDVCKDLGDKDAPVVSRKSRFGTKRVRWSQVDMADIKVQICAASTLGTTPAGREQTLTEWAQAGIISRDSALRLIAHPDLQSELSLYTAALDDCDDTIEQIESSQHAGPPEPFQNLAMLAWRGQQRYLIDRDLKAPEEVLDALRDLVVTAIWMKTGGNTPALAAGASQMPAQVGAAPGAPQAPPPMPMQQLQAGIPMAGPAQAAFSPQAMQLVSQ